MWIKNDQLNTLQYSCTVNIENGFNRICLKFQNEDYAIYRAKIPRENKSRDYHLIRFLLRKRSFRFARKNLAINTLLQKGTKLGEYMSVGIRIFCNIPTLRELQNIGRRSQAQLQLCARHVALIDWRYAYEPLNANRGSKTGCERRVEIIREYQMRAAHFQYGGESWPVWYYVPGGQIKTTWTESGESNILARKDVDEASIYAREVDERLRGPLIKRQCLMPNVCITARQTVYLYASQPVKRERERDP